MANTTPPGSGPPAWDPSGQQPPYHPPPSAQPQQGPGGAPPPQGGGPYSQGQPAGSGPTPPGGHGPPPGTPGSTVPGEGGSPRRRGSVVALVVIGVSVLVLLTAGGIGAAIYLTPAQQLTAPDSPCGDLEDEIDGGYSASEGREGGYYTCGWALESEDSGELFLNVDYEAVTEPKEGGGGDPEEIASYLVRRVGEVWESGDDYEVGDSTEITDIGDEARGIYASLGGDEYETATYALAARRANVVVTVEVTGGGTSSYGQPSSPTDEDELRPVAEDMAKDAIAKIGTQTA